MNEKMSYQLPTSIHSDLSRPATVDTRSMPWQPSPQSGIERRMLERDGGEVARATSLVRYAPGSTFPQHTHGAGEEFFVLEGVFSDEHGDYPAGTYVRNPPGSFHSPFTQPGCIILVKLRQMRPQGEPQIVIDTGSLDWEQAGGHARKQLFVADWGEWVLLEKLEKGEIVPSHPGTLEVFILKGSMTTGDQPAGTGTWLRFPTFPAGQLGTTDGCEYWVKRELQN